MSGFQIHFSSNRVYTPGDVCDVLVAMNAAALKVNLKGLKKGERLLRTWKDLIQKFKISSIH